MHDTFLCECRLSSPRATDSFVEKALYTSGGRNTGADRKDGVILFRVSNAYPLVEPQTKTKEHKKRRCCRHRLFFVKTLSAHAFCNHSVGNFLESRKVCARNEIVIHAVCVECVADLCVNAFHDLFEFCIHFFARPCKTFAVL